MASYRFKADRPDRPWVVDYRTPEGDKRTKSFTSEKDARDFAAEVTVDVKRGGFVDPRAGRMTFAQLAEEYARGRTGIGPARRDEIRRLLDLRILPVFGKRRLDQITTASIRAWVADMETAKRTGDVGRTGRGYSASHMRKSLGLLKMILQTAVTDHPRRLLVNPAAGVNSKPIADSEKIFFDAGQLEALYEALESQGADRGLVADLGGWQGWRAGEMLALRRRRVDLANQRLLVARNIVEIRGELLDEPTKNREEVWQPMLGSVAEHLERRLHRVDLDPDAFVLTSSRGEPLRYRNLRRWFDRAVADAGLSEHATLHSLRHTCAALLIEQGWHPKEVQTHLRHKTIGITMDTYGHLFPANTDRRMSALEESRQQARERILAAAEDRALAERDSVQNVSRLDDRRAHRT